MVHGLDISHWQFVTPPLGAQDFVFCRATYGTSRDGKYTQHAANVRRAGKVLGAYHFGRSGSVVSVNAQVLAFLSVSAGADLLVLDLENDAGNPDMTVAEASHFMAEVKRLRPGVPIGLYHSLSGFPLRLGQQFNWVAKWSPTPPSIPWAFWQYTSDGSLPGYTGRLDMNRYNGTLADLRALAGGGSNEGDEKPMIDGHPMNGGVGTVTVKAGRGLLNLVTGEAIITDDPVKTSYCRFHLAVPYGDGAGRQDGYLVRHANQSHLALDDVVASFTPDPAAPVSVSYDLRIDGKAVATGTVTAS
jgi:lysozyme